jgi:hypothetical protein
MEYVTFGGMGKPVNQIRLLRHFPITLTVTGRTGSATRIPADFWRQPGHWTRN